MFARIAVFTRPGGGYRRPRNGGVPVSTWQLLLRYIHAATDKSTTATSGYRKERFGALRIAIFVARLLFLQSCETTLI